jgi:hypothetical protein
MDLRPGMKVTVATVTVASPAAGDRPRYLPADAEWPAPGVIIYLFKDKYGSTSGYAACSDCIRDTDAIDAYWAKTSRSDQYLASDDIRMKVASGITNHEWHCTVGSCRKYGDRL